jgi:osmotically-inducible protein OsmY
MDGVDALAIEVAANGGSIELRGEVPTHAERLAATMLAARVVPKSSVLNLLTVAPSGRMHTRSDHQIAEDVAMALARSGAGTTGLSFRVRHHVVTLDGAAPDDHTRARIRHVIAQVPGVHIVQDRTRPLSRPRRRVHG